jgi:hypothetical protein
MLTRALAVVLVLLAAACRASSTSAKPRLDPVAPVPERHWPAFEALADAVRAREDRVARSILDALLARLALERPRAEGVELAGIERAQAIASGYDRILTGRALLEGIALELVTVVVPATSSVRVVLRASSTHATEAALRPGPGTLRVHQTSLAPNGAEMHSVWTTHVAGVERVHVPAQGTTDVPLGSFPLAVPADSIAVRVEWDLLLRSGEVLVGEEAYPASDIQVREAALERLAPVLPDAPVDPAELARYASGATPWVPALLERAVRVPRERREEALEALAPLVASGTEAQLERLAPALRWLSGERDPTEGPLGWKRMLAERAERSERERASAPASGLDIR